MWSWIYKTYVSNRIIDGWEKTSSNFRTNRWLSNSQGLSSITLCLLALVAKVMINTFIPTSIKDVNLLILHTLSIVLWSTSFPIPMTAQTLSIKLLYSLLWSISITSPSNTIENCSSSLRCYCSHFASKALTPSISFYLSILDLITSSIHLLRTSDSNVTLVGMREKEQGEEYIISFWMSFKL